MTSRLTNPDAYPHQTYADAVHAALAAAGLEPAEWATHEVADESRDYPLAISYLWRPYETGGVALTWHQIYGWSVTAFDTEPAWDDPAVWAAPDLAPVAWAADPAELVTFVRLLLAGTPDAAPNSNVDWQHVDDLCAALSDHYHRPIAR